MLFLNGINDSKIPVQISQLLFDFSPNYLRGLCPGFGETDVLPLSFFTIGLGFGSCFHGGCQ